MNLKDLRWLAGWLEGEGSFGLSNSGGRRLDGTKNKAVRVCACTTDKDIAERVHALIGGDMRTEQPTGSNLKKIKGPLKLLYRLRVSGPRARGLMMTLYPLMGERRKQRIYDSLIYWIRSNGDRTVRYSNI